MKKQALISALLLLCSGLAGAQTWLTAPCIVSAEPLYPVPTTAAKPMCLPAPAGAGTALVIESNDAGVAGAWWCKGASGKPPTLYLYAARWDSMSTTMLADAAVVALSSAKTSAIQAHLAKYQTADIRDMCDVWGPAAERIRALKPTS